VAFPTSISEIRAHRDGGHGTGLSVDLVMVRRDKNRALMVDCRKRDTTDMTENEAQDYDLNQ